MSSLNTKAIGSIIFTDTLKSHNDIHSIIGLLVAEIQKIPEFGNLHMNMDLVVWICKCADQILTDSRLKNIDKFALFKEVYIKIFPDTTDKEFATIKNMIDYLHTIKKIGSVKTSYKRIFLTVRGGLHTFLNLMSLS